MPVLSYVCYLNLWLLGGFDIWLIFRYDQIGPDLLAAVIFAFARYEVHWRSGETKP